MLPGYADNPYFSPILIQQIEPLKTGQSLVRLEFINAGYADGVQDFEKQLKVLMRGSNFLMAELIEPGELRGAVISELNEKWLKNNCQWVFGFDRKPPFVSEIELQLNLTP